MTEFKDASGIDKVVAFRFVGLSCGMGVSATAGAIGLTVPTFSITNKSLINELTVFDSTGSSAAVNSAMISTILDRLESIGLCKVNS